MKIIGWILAILLALGLIDYVAENGTPDGLPQLGAVPWQHIQATSYRDDCEKAGGATYGAAGEKDGQVMSFERPCAQAPPEHLR